VNKAIMQMDETTQQNAALVEEATSASQSMKEQAKELMSQVASFKMLDQRQGGRASAAGMKRPTHVLPAPAISGHRGAHQAVTNSFAAARSTLSS
jgi:methyl-accepting chemotaxis protein